MAKKKKEEVQETIEKTLWKAADKLRKNINAAEYKDVVLGLIFLKYISIAFEKLHAELTAQIDQGADPEGPRRGRFLRDVPRGTEVET